MFFLKIWLVAIAVTLGVVDLTLGAFKAMFYIVERWGMWGMGGFLVLAFTFYMAVIIHLFTKK